MLLNLFNYTKELSTDQPKLQPRFKHGAQGFNPFPARGFVNSISSSTTCFSVMEELFDGIA